MFMIQIQRVSLEACSELVPRVQLEPEQHQHFTALEPRTTEGSVVVTNETNENVVAALKKKKRGRKKQS